MSISDQIWLSIVDKALLGGIVAMGGYYGTRAIEAFKAKQLLRTELTKQRVLKIEEVWKMMIEIDALIGPLQKGLVKSWIVPAFGQPDEARLQEARESWRKVVSSEKVAVDEISAKFNDMFLSIHRNSFWLGRDLTTKAEEQLTSIRSGFTSLLDGDTIKIIDDNNFSVTMTATRHNVDVDYIMANV